MAGSPSSLAVLVVLKLLLRIFDIASAVGVAGLAAGVNRTGRAVMLPAAAKSALLISLLLLLPPPVLPVLAVLHLRSRGSSMSGLVIVLLLELLRECPPASRSLIMLGRRRCLSLMLAECDKLWT